MIAVGLPPRDKLRAAASSWLKSGAGASSNWHVGMRGCRKEVGQKQNQQILIAESKEENQNNNHDHNLPKDHPIKVGPTISHSAAQSSQPTSCSHPTGARYSSSLGFKSVASDHRPLVVVFMFSFAFIQLFASIALAITTPSVTWRHYRNDYTTNHNQMRLPWAAAPTANQPNKLIIPSARYVYTTSSMPQNDLQQQQQDARRDKILFLHSQLNQLKRELDVELGSQHQIESNASETAASTTMSAAIDGLSVTLPPIGRNRLAPPIVALGSPCLSSSFCTKSIKNSQCNLDTFTCACLSEHVKLNSTTCLAPSLLGYDCQLDSQCQQRVPESICQLGRCACPANAFVPYRKNKCLSASKLNDYCLLDSQCQLNDKHSFCKWKIHNIYGTCKCPPNYKLLSDNKNNLKCVPRLGDTCLSDQECQLATANSICKSQASEGPGSSVLLVSNLTSNNNKWLTSSASTDRCSCSNGFKTSSSQLDCVPIESQPAPPPPPPPLVPSLIKKTTEINGTNVELSKGDQQQQQQQKDSHKYEMIVMPDELDRSAVTTSATTSISAIVAGEQQRPAEVASASEREELEIKVMSMDSSSEPRRQPSTTTSPPATTSTTTTTTTEKPPPPPPPPQTQAPTALPVPPQKPMANVTGLERNQTSQFRMSSLGKPCRSSQECQARDPFSDCIGGICECLVPSERCRASQTGCHPDTFQCRNGQCISWYFVCDQFKNCDDGSDEDDCKPSQCPREAFQCHEDGACLTKGKVCNGKRDCLDGSDELNCDHSKQSRPPPTLATTAPTASATTTTTTTTQPSANNSFALGCHPDAFTCSNGQCLPGYVFCNAVEDCADGSDEDESVCERQRPPPKGASASLIAVQDGGVTRGDGPSATAASQLDKQAAAGGGGHSQLDQESPLVKTDRASIERLMASLTLGQWTPEGRGRPRSTTTRAPPKIALPTTTTTTTANNTRLMRRKSKLLTDRPRPGQSLAVARSKAAGKHQDSSAAKLHRANIQLDECPRWAFTCRNGKCRSSAILCSGVDGCGDNSDEDQCEVCQCEAPPVSMRPKTGGSVALSRATNPRRRNRWTTSAA